MEGLGDVLRDILDKEGDPLANQEGRIGRGVQSLLLTTSNILKLPNTVVFGGEALLRVPVRRTETLQATVL